MWWVGAAELFGRCAAHRGCVFATPPFTLLASGTQVGPPHFSWRGVQARAASARYGKKDNTQSLVSTAKKLPTSKTGQKWGTAAPGWLMPRDVSIRPGSPLPARRRILLAGPMHCRTHVAE